MPSHKQQLIVFVKTPIAGNCKTRLIPALSAQQACDFYKELVSISFQNIKNITQTDIAIYCYPDIKHPFIEMLGNKYNASLHQQQGNDLGEKMHAAITTSLKKYDKCVLIGTDCPFITSSYIKNAFSSLNNNTIVFGPAEDGGYVLIGATKINEKIFENITWSSHKVLQQSIDNNVKQNYTTHLLDTLWDIDTPEDYHRFKTNRYKKIDIKQNI